MTLCGVRFQMRSTICFSSSLAVSIEPSILMRSEVRMTANRVAVKLTVPSGFRGMFMATMRCIERMGGRGVQGRNVCVRLRASYE